uniref:GH5_13 / GH5 n=1 Tax=uncultured Segetibacter sp. TaxID=481133 RepID=A0A6J4U0C9_9BACT|nr:MAG: GH5_13 / GH5 [uncultured Segetibacter sp.]
MRHYLKLVLFSLLCFSACTSTKKATNISQNSSVNGNASNAVWTTDKANNWYAQQTWLVGGNYTPAYSINQLEFWQKESFDTARINTEFTWAENIGMNTMRVFLHDLLYQQDSTGFYDRINQFLTIANRHHIKIMFVLFDSCWDPFPKLGKQREPTPGVHNSGWVQSPGAIALTDSTQYPRLEKYVKAIVGRYANDARVIIWDVWNEPDNTNASSYGKQEPVNKVSLTNALLAKAFQWAHAVNPSQPLTSGVWKGGDWSKPENLDSTQQIQLNNSDIITFHSYDPPEEFRKRVVSLQPRNRPIICTEYMARPQKSTFESTMPIAKEYKVGVYNWGFVEGKSQTNYPWDSWQKAYTSEPPVWFHDIFRTDGTPYRPEEVNFIKSMTSASKK